MGRIFQHDWAAIRQEYIQNPVIKQEELAKKFGVTQGAVRGRAYRDHWMEARAAYARDYADRLVKNSLRHDAPRMLREANEKQLKQNDELRVMLNAKLKMVDASGKVIVRPEVTITDLHRAVGAFAELFRMDRLALGASTDNITPASTVNDRYADMGEDELLNELRQVRARITIQ